MDAGERVTAGPRRWLILAVVTIAAFVTNLDATIVIIGLPRIVSSLHTTITAGLWTVTSYIIATTVFLLPAGRWSDASGRRRTFVFGLALFSAGTVLCGLSATGAELIAFRLVQGVGGAFAVATGTPVLVEVFPTRELGRALGTYATAWVIGSIVGPVAGGAIVGSLGWRWIFFVSAPFGVIGAVLGLFVVPKSRAARAAPRTDWVGIVTFAGAVTCLMVLLSEGLGWGWGSWRIVALSVATVVLVALFVRVESSIAQPLFEPGVVRHSHYRTGLVVTLLYATGFFATTFLLAFYLQGAVHLSPLDAGLMLIPLSAPQIVMAPLGGHLADRLGSARLMLLGLVLLAASALLLSRLGPELSVAAVVWPLLLMSAANGLAWPPLVRAVMSTAPPGKEGAASGIFYTVRYLGSSLSFTLALVIAELSLPPVLAVRIYLGTSARLDGRTTRALVRSIDSGFRIFVAFYLAAAFATVFLLRPSRSQPEVPKREACERSSSSRPQR